MFLPSRNFYKCKQVVYVIVICISCLRLSLQSCCCIFTWLSPFLYCTVVVACLLLYTFLYCTVVVACLLLWPFFILMLLLFLCLFVHHVNKAIILFCHFNNTISILVTIFSGVWACLRLNIFTMKPVSRTLISTSGTVGPSLRLNFFASFSCNFRPIAVVLEINFKVAQA